MAERYRRLQYRLHAQRSEGSDTVRIHLQTVDIRARAVQGESDPSNAGTEHLTKRSDQSPVGCGRRRGTAVYAWYMPIQGTGRARLAVSAVVLLENPSMLFERYDCPR